MNALIYINDVDATEVALLDQTKLNYDSSKRITTGSITVLAQSPGIEPAVYDDAFYDVDQYVLDVAELYPVRILDGRDGVTKLFEGNIYSIDISQTDGQPAVLMACDLNDYGAWLDRAVAWDTSFNVPLPNSDVVLIQLLITKFCPQVKHLVLTQILPTIMDFDWQGKTSRQIMDDISSLSGGEWHIDFEGWLWYGPATAAPQAPFDLSTSPDYITTFPVRVDGWKRDFTNPINRAFVRGAVDAFTGVPVQAEYSDPVSIDKYGEYSYSIVDDQITNAYDAELKAKTTVLKNAWPTEQGTFTIWQDGLSVGQVIHILEESLGIDGDYIIRSMNLAWVDQWVVEYKVTFGAAQPDLETYLRLIDQRSKWKTSKAQAGVPVAGSVTDSSISGGGLHAESIESVNVGALVGLIQAGQIGTVSAGAITGQIAAGQIGSVNAGIIVGQVQGGQIGSVNATTIQGAITSGQIGSVNATTIQGVVVTSQLANGIIDDLAKYATALRPIQTLDTPPSGLPNDNFPPGSFFYYTADATFYQITGDGRGWTPAGTNPDVTGAMKFYHIGKIAAGSITGLIVAAQIQSITAGQITGAIQAAQIGSVNASTIQGSITAGQIASVNATAIQGSITAAQITSITADKITGALTATQIGSINAATITIGLLNDTQIGNISGSKLNVGTVDSTKLNATEIKVGGGGGKPGKLGVYDAAGALVAELGLITGGSGGWFKVFGAGGSSYTNAKIYTDTAGNLFARDADFKITSGAYSLYSSTSTFDPTYATLAWVVDGGGQKTSHISRGVVFYEGASKIGYVGRHPTTAALEIECTAGVYVHIGGNDGIVRADGGFQVAANAGRSTEIIVTATNGQKVNMKFTKGMLYDAVILP